MDIQSELKELLLKIDGIRDIGDYTMTELQKISEKAIIIISKDYPRSESIFELKESITLSNNFHKERSHKDADNVMDVLRSTKFAIESFLHKEFDTEI